MAQDAAPVESPWKFSGTVGLNAAATGLLNWSAGGNNNINGVAYGRLRLVYGKDNLNWDTNLDMEYGLTWIDQEFDKLQKSSDKFNFNTKFGWDFKDHWNLTAQVGFNTQFANGRNYTGSPAYNPIISRGLAPAYVDMSVGFDWKPNTIFSVYLSPVAGRITTVYIPQSVIESEQKELGADYRTDVVLKEKYGVWFYDKGVDDAYVKSFSRNARAELGMTLKGMIDYSYKGMNIKTALTLFTPYKWDKTMLYTQDGESFYTKQIDATYEAAGYRDNNRRFGNFDVDWTVALSYQFLKCLQVTFSTDLRYYNGEKIADKNGENAKERVQLKGVLGVGVGYSF